MLCTLPANLRVQIDAHAENDLGGRAARSFTAFELTVINDTRLRMDLVIHGPDAGPLAGKTYHADFSYTPDTQAKMN